MNIDKLDALYQDVWTIVNLTKKADRIAFFKIWLKDMGVEE